MKPSQVLAASEILQSYFPDTKLCLGAVFLEALDAFEGAGESKKARPAIGQNESDDFVKFYEAYPLKKSRRSAAKAYNEALKRAPAGIILAGAQRYAAEMAGTDPRYIKHPGTWLRADCWADAPPTLALVQTGYEEATEAGWVRRLETFMGKADEPKGTWRVTWGAKPGETNCKVPEAAKTKYREIYPRAPKAS